MFEDKDVSQNGSGRYTTMSVFELHIHGVRVFNIDYEKKTARGSFRYHLFLLVIRNLRIRIHIIICSVVFLWNSDIRSIEYVEVMF